MVIVVLKSQNAVKLVRTTQREDEQPSVPVRTAQREDEHSFVHVRLLNKDNKL